MLRLVTLPCLAKLSRCEGLLSEDEGGYFILDIRDCSISPNLSHFLPELIPDVPARQLSSEN